MRRVALLVVVLVLAAASAAPASAQFGGVVVVGHGTLAGGSVVSVGAFEFNGFVGGRFRVDNGGGFVFVSRVTCIRDVGDRVLVGGVIVSSPTPATLGHTSLVAIKDGGPGGTDSVGIAFSSSGLDTCPVFALGLQAVSSGSFVVLRL